MIVEGIHTKAPVQRFFNNLAEAREFLDQEETVALDLETSGLSPFHDYITVVGLYGRKTETACIIHTKGFMDDELKAWLGQPRVYVTQNGVCFDILFLAVAGVDVFTPTWTDTLIAEQVIIATDRSRVSKKLAAIVERRLGVKIDKNIDHRMWVSEFLDDAQLKYVAEDISFLPDTWDAQLAEAERMAEKWGATPHYKTTPLDAIVFEHQLITPVIRMELRGLPIDESALDEYYVRQSIISQESLERLYEIAGGPMKPNYHGSVKAVALDKFGVKLPGTAVDVLEEIYGLSTGSPIQEYIRLILDYRHAAKRASMYNSAFMAKYCHDGWLKSRFRQMGTNTGRFSSTDPNLQQIPKARFEGDMGGARHIFGNLEGHKIVSVDYSQIEVRIAADIAGDADLIAILDSEDVHTAIASQVFGVPPEEISKEQRQLSKAMSFTLLFGGGAPLLASYAKSLGADLPLSKARPIVEDFFARFRGLHRMRMQAYAVQQAGRAFTIRFPTGVRRVLVPGVDLRATVILNNMVQGTAAVGLKKALILAEKRGLSQYIGAVVHDEVVATVPNQYAEQYARELKATMIEAMQEVCSDAPVSAEISIGDTWG